MAFNKNGIVFGILTLFITGFQPIVSLLRPGILDPYFFAFTTTIFEAMMFLPLYCKERREPSKNGMAFHEKNDHHEEGRIFPRLILISMLFAIALPFFYLGYDLSTPGLGALMIKSTILYSLLYGAFFLKEEVTKKQVLLSFLLLGGLGISLLQGTIWDDPFIVAGAIMLLLVALAWVIGHGLTKPMLDEGKVTSIKVIFTRNILGACFLLIVYVMVFPIENLGWLLVPEYLSSALLMALSYALGHFCWYKCLEKLPISIATGVVSPTPLVTGLFGMLFLGSSFTALDIIGTIVVITSIILIMREKRPPVPLATAP